MLVIKQSFYIVIVQFTYWLSSASLPERMAVAYRLLPSLLCLCLTIHLTHGAHGHNEEDLSITMKMLIDDNEQLKASVQLLVSENKMLKTKCWKMESDISNLKDDVSKLESNLARQGKKASKY